MINTKDNTNYADQLIPASERFIEKVKDENINEATKLNCENIAKPKKMISISIIRMFSFISIIVYHIFFFWTDAAHTYFPLYFAVQIFLFLSGFLYSKHEIKNTKKFLIKNIIKILVPAILYLATFGVICLVCLCFGYHVDIGGIVSPNGTIVYNLGHLWFVNAICICYLLIPFLSNLVKFYETRNESVKNKKCFLLLIAFFIVVCLIDIMLILFFKSKCVIMPFIVGYLFKYGFEKVRDSKNKIWISIISLVLSIAFSVYYYYSKYFLSGNILDFSNEISAAFIAIFFTIFLLLCLDCLNNKNKKYPMILKLSDKYSYYIYFTHHIFLLGSLSIRLLTNNIFLQILLIIILTIVYAIILEFISAKSIKFLFKKIKL